MGRGSHIVHSGKTVALPQFTLNKDATDGTLCLKPRPHWRL